MTTAWAHLPNAALIDEVLTSLKAHPEKWVAARSAAQNAAWNAARDAARNAARDAVWNAARDAVWNAARDAVWNAAWGVTRDVVWGAADDVISALIAYDDAGQFMKLPAEQFKAMYRLDPHPMYLLLQPAAAVFVGVEP